MLSPDNPILGINHVGIVAHDLPALQNFYARAAGLQPWSALDALGLPGGGVALAGPNAGVRLLPGASSPRRRHVSEAGFTHLCFQSPAITPLHRAFAEAGATFHSPLVDLGTGFLYCYARDPEHNVTELEGVAPVWTEPQPWLAHVNVACADLRAQCSFYGNLLGNQAARSPHLANDVRLDRIAAIDAVALRMAWLQAGNMQIELIHYSAPAAAATTSVSTRREAGANGHAYIAFEVSDLQAALQHVVASGGAVPRAGSDLPVADGLAHATDAEGNALWLLERRWLEQHGASFAQLPQPDITARFAAARAQQPQKQAQQQGAA